MVWCSGAVFTYAGIFAEDEVVKGYNLFEESEEFFGILLSELRVKFKDEE